MGGKLELELELEFPEPIIQHIQSFLTGKEAARTTILSKSWHSAWLFRPNLDFDESNFKTRGQDYYGHKAILEFSKHALKTIERYEQSNLKIESFKLCNIDCPAGTKFPNELIVKALGKLGATHLSLRLNPNFAFPCEVVFGAENLVELSVEGCRMKNGDVMVKKGCRLESLSLVGVDTTREMVSKIISSCPLIEKLSLSNNHLRGDVQIISDATANCHLHRLRCLVLCYESYETLFPGDLLSKFPFLTDFTLKLSPGCPRDEVQISNGSLVRIKIESKNCRGFGRGQRVKLDVPSIRKFTFEGGDIIPSLSFVSSSTREWESHVSLTHVVPYTTSWLRVLNEFLAELRQSKIHLSLNVSCFDSKVEDMNIIRKHELENLTIDLTGLPSYSWYAILDGLFRLCRPKLITQQNPLKMGPGGYFVPTNIDPLGEILELGRLVKNRIPTQFMYGLNDLEEVNAQIFDAVADDDVPDWRPIPLKSLRDAEHRHRFLLKWKP